MNNQNKKSQITVFLIIGLVILLMMALALFVRTIIHGGQVEKEVETSITELPFELKPLGEFIDNCIEKLSFEGLYLLGLQGGYIYLPENYVPYYSNVAYAYYEGNTTLPSLEDMENQLAIYLNKMLPLCTENFTSFKEFGWKITNETAVLSSAKITKDTVIVYVGYPVEVDIKGKKSKIGNFSKVFPVRVGYLHSIAENITNKVAERPDWIDLTYLGNFYDVETTIIPVDIENLIYAVTDNKSVVKGNPYIFMFANKFSKNMAPQLMINDTFFIKDGVPFEYRVMAIDDDNISFSDDTPMFDITHDGWINFTPEVLGEVDVLITVSDTHAQYDSRMITFVIEETG